MINACLSAEHPGCSRSHDDGFLWRREWRRPPTLITVNVTTDVSNIETFQTVQFAATVTGTSNTAVTWQLTCGAAGSVCGSITPLGVYTAPNTVPTVSTMTALIRPL